MMADKSRGGCHDKVGGDEVTYCWELLLYTAILYYLEYLCTCREEALRMSAEAPVEIGWGQQ